jgi:hypothetical protein
MLAMLLLDMLVSLLLPAMPMLLLPWRPTATCLLLLLTQLLEPTTKQEKELKKLFRVW